MFRSTELKPGHVRSSLMVVVPDEVYRNSLLFKTVYIDYSYLLLFIILPSESETVDDISANEENILKLSTSV